MRPGLAVLAALLLTAVPALTPAGEVLDDGHGRRRRRPGGRLPGRQELIAHHAP